MSEIKMKAVVSEVRRSKDGNTDYVSFTDMEQGGELQLNFSDVKIDGIARGMRLGLDVSVCHRVGKYGPQNNVVAVHSAKVIE